MRRRGRGSGRPTESQRHAWREVLENLGAGYTPDAPRQRTAPDVVPRPESAPQTEELAEQPASQPEEVDVAMPDAPVSKLPEDPAAAAAADRAAVATGVHGARTHEPSSPPAQAGKKYSPELKAKVRRLVRGGGVEHPGGGPACRDYPR